MAWETTVCMAWVDAQGNLRLCPPIVNVCTHGRGGEEGPGEFGGWMQQP